MSETSKICVDGQFVERVMTSQTTPAEVIRIVARAARKTHHSAFADALETEIADKLESAAQAKDGAGDDKTFEASDSESAAASRTKSGSSPASPSAPAVEMRPCEHEWGYFAVGYAHGTNEQFMQERCSKCGIARRSPAPSGHLTHEQGAGYGAAPSAERTPPRYRYRPGDPGEAAPSVPPAQGEEWSADEMRRQAESLEYIALNVDALSDSQTRSLMFAAKILRSRLQSPPVADAGIEGLLSIARYQSGLTCSDLNAHCETIDKLAAALTAKERDLQDANAWADNLQMQLASAKDWQKRNRERAEAAESSLAAAQKVVEAMRKALEAARVVAGDITAQVYSARNDFNNLTSYRVDMIYDAAKKLQPTLTAALSPASGKAGATAESKGGDNG